MKFYLAPPPKMRVAPQMPPKFRDLAPPLPIYYSKPTEISGIIRMSFSPYNNIDMGQALTKLYIIVHFSNITYSLFMATSCCIFGSLSCKYEKPIVVMTTTSGGSLVFLYGRLFFCRTKVVSVGQCRYRFFSLSEMIKTIRHLKLFIGSY